jgi:hypothetical protein
MDKIPLSAYDFFGYLFAGVLLLAGTDYACDLHWVIGRQPDVTQSVVWLVIVYVLGQVNAHWAGWLLEGKFLRWLGRPEQTLFATTKCVIFKHYRAALPEQTRTLVLEKYERLSGTAGSDSALYLFCYHLVKEQCPQAAARLQTFLNLYGFSRNLSFATGLLAVIFFFCGFHAPRPFHWRIILACLVVSLTLFYRYLKFFRHFSVEVYASFLTGVKEQRESLQAQSNTFR